MAGVCIGDWLGEATERLAVAGVDEPRLDAELLLSHHLGLTRVALVAHPDRLLAPAEIASLTALLARRAGREPLPYILGTREFFGLHFAVDPRVLIPRPETELLVERALLLVSRRQPSQPLRIADVGTGSGCIAVALATHLPNANIYATDVSAGALAVAQKNAATHGVESRVRFLLGDLLSPLPQPMHLIVANLPYVARQEWDMLSSEVGYYEPRPALDGGPDGLDLVRRLLAQAPAYLLPGGALLLEIGAGQGEAVKESAFAAFGGGATRAGMPIGSQPQLYRPPSPQPSPLRGEGVRAPQPSPRRGEGRVRGEPTLPVGRSWKYPSVMLFADLAGHARIVQVST
ncbi:MAG: peptide chain release factor N(5)-glutamine methyltransferase [Anaerolineae bacterium]|nr:peptide chain release factor N(5)-glutamine methyltransferase [Anaerolineae bacterium]